MAQKRMFDKRVVGTDKFMELPMSSKALYFLAGMEADDKGFFEPKKLQKVYGFSDDDFKVLMAKQYLIVFETGVMVITDWNKNNWLDSRRIQETEYINELKLLEIINEKYELGTYAKQMLSENSIEENRIVQNSIEENSVCTNDLFNSFWKAYPKKVGKGDIEKWFDKKKPSKDLVDTMIKQIKRFKDTKQWQERNGKFIPNPSTWLNQKRWEDEFETETEELERIMGE